jgi:hypothetical protein
MRFFANVSVDFVANEGGEMMEAPLPSASIAPGGPGLVYVISVRQPLDRILSHFKHESLAGKFPKGLTFPQFVRDDAFVHWKSNFYVRLLGGCGFTPQCTIQHLIAAMDKVSTYFSVILMSDDKLAYEYSAEILLKTRLGWSIVEPGPFRSKRFGVREGVSLADHILSVFVACATVLVALTQIAVRSTRCRLTPTRSFDSLA